MGVPIDGIFFPLSDGSDLPALAQLVQHVRAASTGLWRPDFIVLHNTAPPTLAQRPRGFSRQNMEDLADFYAAKGWHAGPHWFVDDRGCWAFSTQDRRGVHSPSWNGVSWGVEQLGDYETDAYDSGRGAQVRDNAVTLLAVLHHRLGIDSDTLRFHKEDPATDHRDCPGSHCVKSDVIGRVHARIVALRGLGVLPS